MKLGVKIKDEETELDIVCQEAITNQFASPHILSFMKILANPYRDFAHGISGDVTSVSQILKQQCED